MPTVNATVYQDADYTLEFTIYSDEDETQVRDLTSWGTPVYRIGSLRGDSTSLQKNGQLSDPANGKVQVSLTAAETAALAVGSYNHQLILTDNSGNQQVATDGYIVVKEALPSI